MDNQLSEQNAKTGTIFFITVIIAVLFGVFTVAESALTANTGTKLTATNTASCDKSNGIVVDSKSDYQKAVKSLRPGDSIILKNGIWTDFEIDFYGTGTNKLPICLTAETEGKVIISGESNLKLSGNYLEVSGLVFKNGHSPTNAVITYRANSKKYAYNSRVTRVVIDGFSNPDKFGTDYWVAMYGKNNRFDHNHLSGKTNAGVTFAVRLNSVESQNNHHMIDHNYFGPRQILGSNGGETLRIGTSKYSLIDSNTQVINNFFDRTNGEVEVISSKSGRNVYRGNVFYEARGTLTLRHGNNNLIEDNVFLGNGKDHTGGIRVINGNQTIRNNYLEGLTGIRFGGGFVVMNGVPDSPINRYHQVDNALIENNTLINVENINLAAGSDAERSAIPVNSKFSKNLVINAKEHPFKIFDDVSGIAFTKNLSSHAVPSSLDSGFERIDSDLTKTESGLMISAQAQAKGVGSDLTALPITKDKTGVSWYPKSEPVAAFDSGSVINVSDSDELLTALKGAKDGTQVVLAPGEYNLDKMLVVNAVVSITAIEKDSVTLYPQRSVMVQLDDGGSLKVSNLLIDGVKTPDSAGNVLFRNTRLPTLHNYRFELTNVTIKNLNVNHSAHVLDVGYRSFADSIVIKNSKFENITGDILRLDKEADDLGIYNAEYIDISASTFNNIEGAIAKVYRGGTDESTFGPHFLFANNQVSKVGQGKRNKYRAAIYLHGAQDTDILDNVFSESKPIKVEHTVGEPQTKILNNRFLKTDLPTAVELASKQGLTAIIKGNTQQ